LTPDMNKCGRITLVTRMAKATGGLRAWICTSGFVGTHQDPRQFWPDFDSNGDPGHYFRAFEIACEFDPRRKDSPLENTGWMDSISWRDGCFAVSLLCPVWSLCRLVPPICTRCSPHTLLMCWENIPTPLSALCPLLSAVAISPVANSRRPLVCAA
jgi:hypothetical protein